MTNKFSDIDAVRQILSERPKWYVWVVEYGLTHSLMRLALHDGYYPRHTMLDCTDCLRLEGDLQGGPYVLEVRACDWHGDPSVELCDAEGTFRLVCGSVALGVS